MSFEEQLICYLNAMVINCPGLQLVLNFTAEAAGRDKMNIQNIQLSGAGSYHLTMHCWSVGWTMPMSVCAPTVGAAVLLLSAMSPRAPRPARPLHIRHVVQ